MDKTEWIKIEKGIYQDIDDANRFKVSLYHGVVNGKPKTTNKIIKGTLKDARHYVENHKADVNRHLKASPSEFTFDDMVENYNQVIGIHHAVTTQTSDANIQRHLLEFFSGKKLNKITTSVVREYLSLVITEKQLSANTANKHREHLLQLFNYVLSEPDKYGLYINPVAVIKPFKKVKKKLNIYEPDEAKDLLLSLQQSDRRDLEIAINLAFWCGCRRSETCGLKWESVDLEKNIITIGNIRTTAKGTVVERDSTKNGEDRQVGITPYLHHILEKELERQKEMKALLKDEYHDDGFVFCHDDGSVWHPNSLTRAFNEYLVEHNLKVIRYHDLRHTNASLLLSTMGAVEVATIIGHKQASTTTDIYGHAFDDTVKHGSQALDKIMKLK